MGRGLLEEIRDSRLPAPAQRRAVRRAAGVTQARLAAELGVYAGTISEWERGLRSPRPAAKARYARLLREIEAAIKSAGDAS